MSKIGKGTGDRVWRIVFVSCQDDICHIDLDSLEDFKTVLAEIKKIDFGCGTFKNLDDAIFDEFLSDWATSTVVTKILRCEIVEQISF